jgi:hypothetical protein
MRYNRHSQVNQAQITSIVRFLESKEVFFEGIGEHHLAEVMESGYACLEGQVQGILGELIDPKWPNNAACLAYIEAVSIPDAKEIPDL